MSRALTMYKNGDLSNLEWLAELKPEQCDVERKGIIVRLSLCGVIYEVVVCALPRFQIGKTAFRSRSIGRKHDCNIEINVNVSE